LLNGSAEANFSVQSLLDFKWSKRLKLSLDTKVAGGTAVPLGVEIKRRLDAVGQG
jgi:hypothetical protein